MAVRFDAQADTLTRTASLPAISAFSACGWTRASAAGGSGLELVCALATTDLSGHILISREGTAIWMEIAGQAGSSLITGANNGVWFFWAMTNASGTNNFKGYAALASADGLSTVSRNGATFTPQQMLLSINDAAYYFNGVHAALKVWDAVLTQAELEAERWSYAPVRRANLHLWTPLVDTDNSTRDYSGNGRNWTAGGTLTSEDGPPILWGPSQRARWWKGAGTIWTPQQDAPEKVICVTPAMAWR